MATARELKRRIKSAKNIGQVTRALEMVSAVKMRRAQADALAGRPYTEELLAALRTLSSTSADHPYLRQPQQVSRILLIVIAPHKGLAGSLITNLTRQVLLFTRQLKNGLLNLADEQISLSATTSTVKVITWGKKARNIAVKSGFPIIADFWPDPRQPIGEAISALAAYTTQAFTQNGVDVVVVASSHFINTVTQTPTLIRFLPLARLPGGPQLPGLLYTFEPSSTLLLDGLLTHFVERFFTQIILDNFAAEHSARMVAMKNARESAEDIVKDFTLLYNNTRQSVITNEIADIVSGSFISV